MKKTTLFLLVSLLGAVSLFAEMDKAAFFGKEVYTKDGTALTTETLSAKVYGIYFSAHWCPPCRAFSPVLVETYNKIKEAGGEFEVIFVSSDKSKEAQFEYMTELTMPWYTAAYQSEAANALKEKYEVRGIPMLVIIDANGALITKNGRGDVSGLGEKAYEQWLKE